MDHFYSHIAGWSHYLEVLYQHLVPKLPATCIVVEEIVAEILANYNSSKSKYTPLGT